MSVPHKCPVCDGWGERPDPESTAAKRPCRPCWGTGVVWEAATPPPLPQTPAPQPWRPVSPDYPMWPDLPWWPTTTTTPCSRCGKHEPCCGCYTATNDTDYRLASWHAGIPCTASTDKPLPWAKIGGRTKTF